MESSLAGGGRVATSDKKVIRLLRGKESKREEGWRAPSTERELARKKGSLLHRGRLQERRRHCSLNETAMKVTGVPAS